MLRATVFNIQKFSVHDGPGIRTTVFFKGCPLQCKWCHNPESIDHRRQLLFSKEKCCGCNLCNKIYQTSSRLKETNDNEFERVETYAKNCPTGALEIAGKSITVKQLTNELLKDRQFYEQSGGGVTFSGGEPLLNIDFVTELAKTLKENGISVAIDTSGYVPYTHIEQILPYSDLFLYDLKLMDDVLHQKFTGVSHQLILENLKKLSQTETKIHLRFLLIDGLNVESQHINELLEVCKMINPESIHLLPYHDIAKGKYSKCGKVYEGVDFKAPSEYKLLELQSIFKDVSKAVYIGG